MNIEIIYDYHYNGYTRPYGAYHKASRGLLLLQQT